MDNLKLIERLQELEKEIHIIKSEVHPVTKKQSLGDRIKVFFNIINSYWVIASFIVALVTIFYVKSVYDVDYFDNYKIISTNRSLSNFYRQLGDGLITKREFVAAQTYYEKALNLNPNNVEAVYGVAKSEIFDPIEGEKYWSYAVVSYKLDYLLSKYPEDYQLYYLKGYLYLTQNDDIKAKEWLQKSIEIHPDSSAYTTLGFIEARASNNEGAMQYYRKALELNPEDSMALNNLGHRQLLSLDFENALSNLRKASSIESRLLTILDIADTYRYSGDYQNALLWRSFAATNSEDRGEQDSRYYGDMWLLSYMPLEPGDQETIKYYVQINSVRLKLAAIHYGLSFDYALNKQFEAADEELKQALEMDTGGELKDYFHYRVLSIKGLLKLDKKSQEWFDNTIELLN